MRRLLLSLLLLTCTPPWLLAQFGETSSAGDSTPTAISRSAVRWAKEGRFDTARTLLLSIENSADSLPNILWHLGICSAELGDNDAALRYFLAYQSKEPHDWTVLPMLIQSYQGLGRLNDRDDARSKLLTLRMQRAHRRLNSVPDFRRELVILRIGKVYAYEAFEPTDPRRVFYRFVAYDSAGNDLGTFVLASNERDVRIARENGTIKQDERVYHLEFALNDYYATYGYFAPEMPTYENIRESVVQALLGQLKPLSSSVRKVPVQGRKKLKDKAHELDFDRD